MINYELRISFMNNTEIHNLIKELIEKMDISVKELSINEDNNSKMVWFSADISHPHFFTVRNGEALSALNHLVRRIIENKNPNEIPENRASFLIDINGFQKSKVDNVRAIAHMMAERARYFKSNIEIDPMSAFDRRIVHEFLSDAIDLKTESAGDGMNRRVVIKYIGQI